MTESLQVQDFVRLITDQQRSLYVYILSLVPNRSDADEILQNTNLVLWRKSGDFEPNSNFAAWSTRVAYLEVLNFRSKQRRDSVRFETDVVEAIAATSDDCSDQVEMRRRALANCLGKLRERDREIVRMRYDEQKSVSDIALIKGRSMDAMYQALHRARTSLLACMNRFRTCEEKE